MIEIGEPKLTDFRFQSQFGLHCRLIRIDREPYIAETAFGRQTELCVKYPVFIDDSDKAATSSSRDRRVAFVGKPALE